ncbi:MAG: alanine racemase [Clostridiales bacterium]|nr:alanine racemase [Clostridiales bacterium]
MRGIIEINLRNLTDNLNYFKKNMPHGARLAAVVKADAYGHGAVEVVKAIKESADYFVTASAEEAEEVRELTKKPVLCLAALNESEATRCVVKGIEISVSSESDVRMLAAISERTGVCACVHICVDTGMNRMGIKGEKAAYKLINKALSFKNLSIKGVYSHFFDCSDKEKTGGQFAAFRADMQFVPEDAIRHIAATEGFFDKEYALDMVRIGIGLYGYGEQKTQEATKAPKHATGKLKPVMSLKSFVVRVAKIKRGETVGYGGRFEATEDCFIATISAGYGDGVPRSFTGGSVLIGGKKRKIVGNICMDFCFALVDKSVKAGDEVVFFGRQSGEILTAEDMADACGTISYEILTGVKRFEKVYIK